MIQQFLRVVFCARQKCSGYMVGVILRVLSRPRGIVRLSLSLYSALHTEYELRPDSSNSYEL